MKRAVTILVAIFFLGIFLNAWAGAPKIDTVKSFEDKTSVGWETSVEIIRIEENVGNSSIVCYAIVPKSKNGRSNSGGYPNGSISCVNVLITK